MRTQVINDPTAIVPRLQRIAENGETEETSIESFPFTIGRNGDCDLQIESPKVSREHAVISRERGAFRIKDLGSTNGTSVNGQRIEQADLNDGDIVVIADLEFTFAAAPPTTRRDTVTMAIDAAICHHGSAQPRHRLVREIRRIHEMLTHRGVRCHVNPIMELGEGRLFGFQASHPFQDEPAQANADARALLATESRIAEQLCYLNRLIVAEEALCRKEPANLFLRLHQSEIGGDRLTESLESLAEILSGRHHLVVTVPAGTVGLTSYFTEIRKRLSEIGALVAYDHFEASSTQLSQWSAEPPDFVRLAPSMTMGIGQDRQRRRFLTSLIDTGSDLQIRMVATGLRDRSDVQVCRELGCPLGEGPVFGSLPVNTAFRDVTFTPPVLELASTG
jgi:EAL domain-containing protein (putative c-di-GMP-specific phosphodiesterase class I)